jgi:hypothetical protein
MQSVRILNIAVDAASTFFPLLLRPQAALSRADAVVENLLAAATAKCALQCNAGTLLTR